jgi:hypothetical protein
MDWSDDDRAKFENDLISQRLTWLGTFEGLLFVANNYERHPYVLPVVGILFAISVGRGTYRANKILGLIPPPAHLDIGKDRWKLLMPGTAIPATIILAWVLLFMQNFQWWRSMLHCMGSCLGFS